MDRGVIGALAAIVVVAIVGLLARRLGGGGVAPAATMPVAPEPDAPDDGDANDDEADGPAEVAAVTSDGYAFVPDTHAVRLVPPPEEGEAWKAGETARNRRGERALEMSWHAGDFTGARVVRGAADEGPWRFEAMGRDGEYTAFVFETREGADSALALFASRGVIRLGRDEDEREMAPSPEQFDEARRVFLETEAALDHED